MEVEKAEKCVDCSLDHLSEPNNSEGKIVKFYFVFYFTLLLGLFRIAILTFFCFSVFVYLYIGIIDFILILVWLVVVGLMTR